MIDAERILAYLGWKNWTVAAIQEGIDDKRGCAKGSRFDIIKRTYAMLSDVRREEREARKAIVVESKRDAALVSGKHANHFFDRAIERIDERGAP